MGKETGIEASGTEFRCPSLMENKKTPEQGMGWGGSLPVSSVLTLRREAESGRCPGAPLATSVAGYMSARLREKPCLKTKWEATAK